MTLQNGFVVCDRAKRREMTNAVLTVLTSREGSGMSAAPWPPTWPSAPGLKVMSPCVWLLGPGCCCCRGGACRGGGPDEGPLWCNGCADWLLGWGDTCMPGGIEAWDCSALTGWGIYRESRERQWGIMGIGEHEQPDTYRLEPCRWTSEDNTRFIIWRFSQQWMSH